MNSTDIYAKCKEIMDDFHDEFRHCLDLGMLAKLCRRSNKCELFLRFKKVDDKLFCAQMFVLRNQEDISILQEYLQNLISSMVSKSGDTESTDCFSESSE